MIVNVSNKTDLKVGNEYLLYKQSHAIVHFVTYELLDDVSYYGKIHGKVPTNSTMFYAELLGVHMVISFGQSKNGDALRVVLSKDLYPNQH